jgi:adenosine kinase
MEVVLRYADVVFSNEDEAAALGAKLGWGSDLMEIAKKLADFPKENKNRNRLVVFTQGAKSTIVCHEGKITNFQPIPVRPEEIVDTNGAGDSFVGGFLSRFVQNKPLEECVAAGHYCACECIKRSGCTYPPTPQFTYQKQ